MLSSPDTTKLNDGLRMIHIVESSKDVEAAASVAEAMFASDPVTTDVDSVVAHLYLLLGRTDRASAIARRLLTQEQLLNDPWHLHSLKYIANPSRSNERELRRLAGRFQHERHWASFVIGMVALSNGERDKAIACFEEVMECGMLDGLHPWAYAFKKRMISDLTWPSWIPVKANGK